MPKVACPDFLFEFELLSELNLHEMINLSFKYRSYSCFGIILPHFFNNGSSYLFNFTAILKIRSMTEILMAA